MVEVHCARLLSVVVRNFEEFETGVVQRRPAGFVVAVHYREAASHGADGTRLANEYGPTYPYFLRR